MGSAETVSVGVPEGRPQPEPRPWVRAPFRSPAGSGALSVPETGRSVGGDQLLPAATIPYLFPSRYCESERFENFVRRTFAGLYGGALAVALAEWVRTNLEYAPGPIGGGALHTFAERRGVCRDYAHLLVTLARAAEIPARCVSVYAPGVDPPDFHAVAEVFLADATVPGGGAWHIVDATGMADPADTVKIGVGRDAADVSFMTVFGVANFEWNAVTVSKVP